ncbi:MAG: 16S rRNA (cytosine(967)-C(5))-methyltransferase RsmB [Heliobacteriaceae bacterium]|nr:16S rRNA (cytosine(967)-C(5))-methyltransferase RsmB [Heliobacteriaceae bacterium]
MERSARAAALMVLTAIEERQAYANLSLRHVLGTTNLAKQECNLATELVMGVLRRQNTLDFAINWLLRRPGGLPAAVRRLLRLGAYQVLFLDRVPVAAACHETVELAKQLGTGRYSGLVNGVLRQLARRQNEVPWPVWEDDPEGFLVIRESHPEWLVRRWLKQHGPDTARAICEANNQPVGVGLRVNLRRISRDDFLKLLADREIEARPSTFAGAGIRLISGANIAGLPGYPEGFFSVQDESSMLVAPVVCPQPGEIIVDACAAPGGKTTHLAEVSRDQALIYAWDIHPHKLGLIRQNCERLGLGRIHPAIVDAQDPPRELADQVDRVLVDAPCSGLGVLRRRPELRYRMSVAGIRRLQGLQQNILAGAATLVRPGGILVYSTCTTEPEENFGQIKTFLQQRPDFVPADLASYLPSLNFSPEEKRQVAKGYWQILPHRFNTDGFFIARLQRKLF